MPDGGVLQPDPPMVQSDQTHGYASRSCRKDVKLGRSSGWNPIRAERSRYCIYAFVHKTSVDRVSKQRDLPDNTRDLHGNHTFAISSLRQADEYARSDVTMTVDLHPGESRGYWKQKDPDLIGDPDPRQRWISYLENRADTGNTMLLFRQTKIVGKIHNEKAILLLDTGAEMFIVDTAFARKVGCYIDSSQIQDCVGIGDNVYRTEGRTRIKGTLAGSLVYFVVKCDRNLTRRATSAARSSERDGPGDSNPTLGQDIKTIFQDQACDKTGE
ncbi:LOW QUALITY PROTEIN: hypothetical protein PHMEG_00034380 [Phytophthora megakarya]|uniref:Eukaryotic/viral aspartic protease n=1 Tax=Phytophthora megakarya TaxID=4795 RepID=A0A225UTS6_9STRA|nr:LOW QUALITY PROTEIN: hypothetical protein PHMEG_00034380 [Phytophthora megakarya]